MPRNNLKDMTPEEKQQYKIEKRKEWYQKNKAHYQQRAQERDAEKKAADPNYVSNAEYNREYYRTKIKPMREMIKKMKYVGIDINV